MPNFICTTFRFRDDVESFIDRQANVIHFRSASRVGYSDLGANRARMEKLRKALPPPLDLPPRRHQQGSYVRPPRTDQNIVPDLEL